MMVRDGVPFKKGTQGQDGSVKIGYKTQPATKKLVAKWQNKPPGRRITFLNSKNAELPTATGGKVKITELWKENVKEAKPKTTTKVGGRDTEVYSEILVQFCLAYRLIYGQKPRMIRLEVVMILILRFLLLNQKRILTSGKFSLTNAQTRKKFETIFSSNIG